MTEFPICFAPVYKQFYEAMIYERWHLGKFTVPNGLTIAFHLPHCDLKIGCKGNALSTPTPGADLYSSRTL